MPRKPSDLSDAALVTRAQRGDAQAYGELVQRYQDRVYNALLRMCRHEADALDIAQNAFLQAYQKLDRFDGRAGFYTWLFRIAFNLAISHFRRERGRTRREQAVAEQRMPHLVSDPAAGLEQSEQAERVAEALGRLDSEHRAVLVLRDVEDMDYATIGAVLGVPVGTVKSRLFRARRQLREVLDNEEEALRGAG